MLIIKMFLCTEPGLMCKNIDRFICKYLNKKISELYYLFGDLKLLILNELIYIHRLKEYRLKESQEF